MDKRTMYANVAEDYVAGLMSADEWREQCRIIARVAETNATAEMVMEPSGRRYVHEAEELCERCCTVVTWDDGCVEDVRIEAMDGMVFCSEACAIGDGYRECDGCGEWGCEDEGILTMDGNWYCNEDCAHDYGYECCERCGEWTDDYIIPENGDAIYCSEDHAVRDGLYCCERCGEWRNPNARNEWGPYEVHTQNTWQTESWCEDCYESHAFRCERCDECYDDDWYAGDGCCTECGNGESENLHEYGWTPSLCFYGQCVWSSDTPFLGIELETDSGSERGDYCDELAAIIAEGCCFDGHYWMTEDGSLTNGVEITSHPMTLGFHEVMLPVYREINETAKRYGYVSHDSGNCGLHIHVNRSFFGDTVEAQEAAGYKMMRALQRFERQFTEFSRRTSNNWCHYGYGEDFEPVKKAGKVQYTMADFKRKAKRACECRAHSQALNFQHMNTFEFRIFRGTLKVETLFASMGLVNGLCHVAKNRGSLHFETVDWYTLVDEIVEACDSEYATECLVDYLDSKNLRSHEAQAA